MSSLSLALHVEAANTVRDIEKNYVVRAEAEKRVREYFADIPVMIEIARCESNFRQYTDAGNVLRGGSSGGMVGVFQFFESIHAVPASSLGFDITTLEGNIGYARHVYETQDTTPWDTAKDCWDTPTTPSPTSADTDMLRKQIELLSTLVTLLQKKLALQLAAAQP
jgi:hypothetical protein